jgi:hypothetical protein
MRLRFLAVALSALLGTAASAEVHYPKLFFRYSFLYDNVCSPDTPVPAAYATEATNRESEFTAIWESEAPALFHRLFADFHFKKGFTRKELSATLSACAPKSSASYSYPLIINVSNYLNSFSGGHPRETYKFANTVFHELLHTWVNENLKRPSPLQVKYKDENSSVLSHLHVMALQIMVYKELNKQEWLNWITYDCTHNTGTPVYGRAWEIVNSEGYQAFIDELNR